jgi:hypothetical protein
MGSTEWLTPIIGISHGISSHESVSRARRVVNMKIALIVGIERFLIALIVILRNPIRRRLIRQRIDFRWANRYFATGLLTVIWLFTKGAKLFCES